VNTVDNLGKEAKRRLKHPACARAREHGHESWMLLKAALADTASAARRSRAERVAAFLDYACPDAPVMGPCSRQLSQNAAIRILTHDAEVAHDNVYTAVACGDLDEVKRILTEHPEAASKKGGPRDWPPLLYLCNARLPIADTRTTLWPLRGR
jgi:hypothetical protein